MLPRLPLSPGAVLVPLHANPFPLHFLQQPVALSPFLSASLYHPPTLPWTCMYCPLALPPTPRPLFPPLRLQAPRLVPLSPLPSRLPNFPGIVPFPTSDFPTQPTGPAPWHASSRPVLPPPRLPLVS